MERKKLEVINPADSKVIETIELMSGNDIEKVVDRAYEAQKMWQDKPMHERAELLYRFADILEAHGDEISAISTKEMGKPILQTKDETREAVNLIRRGVERALHLYGTVLPQNVPGLEHDLIVTRREPLGVAACIIPFNFPVELTIQKIIPALIMGNAVAVKAPSSNPLAVLEIGRLLGKAGIPEGVAEVFACDRVAAEVLIKSPKVAAVSLTGSTRAGIEVARGAADTLKTLMLELGGNDPLIVFEDADLDKAADEIIEGRISNNGQVCCATKRVIVQDTIADEMAERLLKRIGALKIGDPFDEEADITTLVSEAAAKNVEELIQQTVAAGAVCLAGGTREGARILPTLLVKVTKDMEIARDMEIFGPVIPLIPFHDEKEAVEIANSSIYGLSSGVMTGDMLRAFRVGGQIESGAVILNGSGAYRHWDQSFGGYKSSGIGREGVGISLEEFSQIKTYVVKGAFKK